MIKKIVTFYGFVVSNFLTLSSLLNAKNPVEISVALSFSLVSYYFYILMLPRKAEYKKAIMQEKVDDNVVLTPEVVTNTDFDPDRRKFLKLIGAAGGTLFLMTIFTRKAEASFFGSMPGPGTVAVKNTSGTQIDPAEKKPTDGYVITEIDDSATLYLGFMNKDGAWFIQKGNDDGNYRYVKGSSSFSTNWTNRASLTYDYFSNVF
jgi:hypothetical protein